MTYLSVFLQGNITSSSTFCFSASLLSPMQKPQLQFRRRSLCDLSPVCSGGLISFPSETDLDYRSSKSSRWSNFFLPWSSYDRDTLCCSNHVAGYGTVEVCRSGLWSSFSQLQVTNMGQHGCISASPASLSVVHLGSMLWFSMCILTWESRLLGQFRCPGLLSAASLLQHIIFWINALLRNTAILGSISHQPSARV